MTNSWKLSRLVFGLLTYFTTKTVFTTAICSQSQVISNNVMSIINCTMNSTVQYMQSETPTNLSFVTSSTQHLSVAPLTGTVTSNSPTIQAVTTTVAEVFATSTIHYSTAAIATTILGSSAIQVLATSTAATASNISTIQGVAATGAVVTATTTMQTTVGGITPRMSSIPNVSTQDSFLNGSSTIQAIITTEAVVFSTSTIQYNTPTTATAILGPTTIQVLATSTAVMTSDISTIQGVATTVAVVPATVTIQTTVGGITPGMSSVQNVSTQESFLDVSSTIQAITTTEDVVFVTSSIQYNTAATATGILGLSVIQVLTTSTAVVASDISAIQGIATTGTVVPATTTIQTTVGGIAPGMSSLQKVSTSTGIMVLASSAIQNTGTIAEMRSQTSAAQAITTSVGAIESQIAVNQTVLQTFTPTWTIVTALSLTSRPTLGQTSENITTSVVSPLLSVASPIALLATTAAPTTTAATTASTNVHPAPNSPRAVQFTFTGNCSEFYNSSTEKGFREHLKMSIASEVNLNVSNIKKFNLTCGNIRVSFTLTPDASNSSAPSVNDSITILTNLIQSGNLIITLPDGRNLTADAASLVIKIIAGPTTAGPTTITLTPIPDESGLSAGAVIGISIGCFIGCSVILIAVYILYCRKNAVMDVECIELQQNTSAFMFKD